MRDEGVPGQKADELLATLAVVGGPRNLLADAEAVPGPKCDGGEAVEKGRELAQLAVAAMHLRHHGGRPSR